MHKTIARFAVSVCLCFLLSGCGLIDYFYLPPGEDTAQELFEAGNDAMREKNYASAGYYYSKLKDNFPFSPYAVEAELSLADAYFLDEEWVEAVEAYKEFELLHPRNEAIPYVLFHTAVANMNSYRSVDRPTTPIQDAYSLFTRLLETYPDTEYAEKSREHMLQCRRMMAEHEIYIGDVYYNMGNPGAAYQRYKEVVTNYSDVEDAHAHAVEKANVAFIRYREKESEGIRREREGSWHDWFDWL